MGFPGLSSSRQHSAIIVPLLVVVIRLILTEKLPTAAMNPTSPIAIALPCLDHPCHAFQHVGHGIVSDRCSTTGNFMFMLLSMSMYYCKRCLILPPAELGKYA